MTMPNWVRIARMKAAEEKTRAAQQANAIPAHDRDCPNPAPADLAQGRTADPERHPGSESYCPRAVDPDDRSGRKTAQRDPRPDPDRPQAGQAANPGTDTKAVAPGVAPRIEDLTGGVPPIYSSRLFTRLCECIRDEAHPRAAWPPPSPHSAAAQSAAPVRPWPEINESGCRCSSQRTSSGSRVDAARRSPRHGQGTRVVSTQSPAPHRRSAMASVGLYPLPGGRASWSDAKIVRHRLSRDPGSDTEGSPPARTPRAVAVPFIPRSDAPSH